jgi:hypothetical protein
LNRTNFAPAELSIRHRSRITRDCDKGLFAVAFGSQLDLIYAID